MVIAPGFLYLAHHLLDIRVQFFKFLSIDSQGLIESFLNENEEIGNYFVGNEATVVLVNVNETEPNDV